MPNFIKIFTLLIMLFLTIGCAGQASVKGSSTSLSVPSDQVPVASVEGNHAEISKSIYNRMVGDTLYFIDSNWDEELQKLKNISIHRLQRGSEQSEMLTDFEDAELISFFADDVGQIYCFYSEEKENTKNFYLRKINQDKTVAYNMEVSYEGISGGEGPLVRIGTVAAGEADREGKVCLAGTQGDLYLFNEEGQIVRIEKAPWDGDTYNGSTCGLVNAGENGIYTWLLNGRKLSLQKVNMENGTLGKAIEVNVEGTANVTLALFNGYDHGIYIADSNSLWCYLPSKEKTEHLLDWGDNTIGLKQHTIDAIGVLEDGSLYIAAHEPLQDVSLVHIAQKDASEISDDHKTPVVTIGILKHMQSSMESLNKGIGIFEEETGYQAELSLYDSAFDMEMALLKGEGPDLIFLGQFGMDADFLATKGVLEDLEPYFEGSSVVKMEDLLPAVQEAGIIDGKFRCVHGSFWIMGLLVKEGVTDNGSWTAEDYIRLGEENPGIPLNREGSNRDWYHTFILENLIKWDMGRFVDWTERKSYFDSSDFISLVERIEGLEIQMNNEKYDGSMEACMNRIFQGEEVTAECYVSNPSMVADYIETMDTKFGSLELAGYPVSEEEPYYIMRGLISLGMNSASSNKEAAWMLLETLLSEEFQKEIKANIPARQDAFNNFYDKDHYGNPILSEEGKKFFRYLVEHAHWDNGAYVNKIISIVYEETSPIWSGDRTAEQAADIIQNRVSVYLNE